MIVKFLCAPVGANADNEVYRPDEFKKKELEIWIVGLRKNPL